MAKRSRAQPSPDQTLLTFNLKLKKQNIKKDVEDPAPVGVTNNEPEAASAAEDPSVSPIPSTSSNSASGRTPKKPRAPAAKKPRAPKKPRALTKSKRPKNIREKDIKLQTFVRDWVKPTGNIKIEVVKKEEKENVQQRAATKNMNIREMFNPKNEKATEAKKQEINMDSIEVSTGAEDDCGSEAGKRDCQSPMDGDEADLTQDFAQTEETDLGEEDSSSGQEKTSFVPNKIEPLNRGFQTNDDDNEEDDRETLPPDDFEEDIGFEASPLKDKAEKNSEDGDESKSILSGFDQNSKHSTPSLESEDDFSDTRRAHCKASIYGGGKRSNHATFDNETRKMIASLEYLKQINGVKFLHPSVAHQIAMDRHADLQTNYESFLTTKDLLTIKEIFSARNNFVVLPFLSEAWSALLMRMSGKGETKFWWCEFPQQRDFGEDVEIDEDLVDHLCEWLMYVRAQHFDSSEYDGTQDIDENYCIRHAHRYLQQTPSKGEEKKWILAVANTLSTEPNDLSKISEETVEDLWNKAIFFSSESSTKHHLN